MPCSHETKRNFYSRKLPFLELNEFLPHETYPLYGIDFIEPQINAEGLHFSALIKRLFVGHMYTHHYIYTDDLLINLSQNIYDALITALNRIGVL